ncbi:MAG: class I SAM-dependent methyltransferase [Pseudomonadota bacterium]
MTQSAAFWNRMADGYAKRPVADEAAYQKKLQITREYLQPDMEMLEFGCGTGSTAIVHAPHVKHIHAIDVSSKMLEIAQGKADAARLDNLTFATSTIEEFDAPDNSLDAVLGMSILHLLEDEKAAIDKVYKILKPGGIFVSSTVCLGERMKFFKFIGPIGRFLGLLPLIKMFTAQELSDRIQAVGFEIDHYWQPDKSQAVFMVAKKAATGSGMT